MLTTDRGLPKSGLFWTTMLLRFLVGTGWVGGRRTTAAGSTISHSAGIDVPPDNPEVGPPVRQAQTVRSYCCLPWF